MARIACIMMQKNETVLLKPWLEYHGALFGYENLYVFDNGSTDENTITTLSEWQTKGVNVDYSNPTVADYLLKGDIVATLIRTLQSENAYDIVFPLDCDEFVVLKQGIGATASKDHILAYAETLILDGGLFRVGTQLFNVINHPGEFAIHGYTKTVIALDGTFMDSDHGHHYCKTSNGSVYKPCEFAYVHYHYKPLAMLKEHARAKLAPFVDVDDPAAVSTFKGPGYHLIGYLTMTEEAFQSWHQGDAFYVFNEFNDALKTLDCEIPF